MSIVALEETTGVENGTNYNVHAMLSGYIFVFVMNADSMYYLYNFIYYYYYQYYSPILEIRKYHIILGNN